MKFAIHKASELDRNAKATVQNSGRLGFSDGAKKKMALEAGGYMVIATNAEDNTDENLYAWIESNDTGGGFKINKAGTYFNVNTKPLLEKLNINYRDKTNIIIYDITDFEEDGKKIYKLTKRIQKRSTRNKNGQP